MDIIISNSSGQPIYEQICRQIKGAVASGKLKPGEPLPSIRNLARDLRISVITTKRAYEELERDGFLVTVAGKGCFVAGMDRELVREEHLRRIEEHFGEAARLAKSAGVSRAEVMEILETVCEGEG